MRLHNLLAQPGGICEQGREVQLRLRYKGPQGVPLVRQVVAMMLPVSEEGLAAAKAAAEKTDGRTLPEGQEYVVRLLQQSLRDPADMSRLLIEDDTDLRDLRAGLVAPQFQWLLDEYLQLIQQEYPETVTNEHAAELEGEARNFSKAGPPGPG